MGGLASELLDLRDSLIKSSPGTETWRISASSRPILFLLCIDLWLTNHSYFQSRMNDMGAHGIKMTFPKVDGIGLWTKDDDSDKL